MRRLSNHCGDAEQGASEHGLRSPPATAVRMRLDESAWQGAENRLLRREWWPDGISILHKKMASFLNLLPVSGGR